MPNQTNPDRQKLNVWVDRSLLAQIDGEAARRGVSRATLVSQALREWLSGVGPAVTRSDLAAAVAAIQESIRSQPIAVQQAQVPAPQPTALPEVEAEPARRSYEDGEAAGREAERARIAAMGWSERRRYLRR